MTNFNQQHQKVNRQLNIAKIVLNVHATEDVATMLERAVRHLQRGLYDETLKLLDSILATEDSIADAYYYHALAMLKGKRPKTTFKSVAVRIDKDLQAGINLDPEQAHYYYLWALLKYDFYMVNGFQVQHPDVEALLTDAENLPIDIYKCEELLNHTNAPDCIVSKLLMARYRP